MRSCLVCRNRGICRALWRVRDTWYIEPRGIFKKDHYLFDNEEEIYQALAKTCKRYQNDEEAVK